MANITRFDLYRERRYGSFHRQLQLPFRVQDDAATATFEGR